jgi:Pseudomurein endo-isopeptidase Pei
LRFSKAQDNKIKLILSFLLLFFFFLINNNKKTALMEETSMHKMNLMQYKVMWDWINQWQRENKTNNLPQYVTVTKLDIGLERIEKSMIMDMYQRVKKWQETHEGKMPEIIGVEGPALGTEPTLPSGSIKARLEAGLGKFNNFTEFWQKIRYRKYAYYYNSSYTLEQEISRVINKQGLNCVDSMQLCYALAREMGYQVEYVHVMCKEGGHIRGQILGHEFKNWTRIDPAAALSTHTHANIGTVWCDYTNAHIEKGNWLRR